MLVCMVCGVEVGTDVPKHIHRCEGHYRCDVCGAKDSLGYHEGRLVCSECRQGVPILAQVKKGGRVEVSG